MINCESGEAITLNEAEWVALGVAATLLAALIAHRLGIIQISIMKREHDLNVSKAAPKIGTTIRLEERPNPGQPVKNLYILTSVYNEGDLAASRLDGQWQLSCSQEGFNRTIPISVDYLGSSRPHKMEHQFGGMQMLGIIREGRDVRIEIGIDLRYFGLEDKGEQRYHAHYRYDPQHKQFIRSTD